MNSKQSKLSTFQIFSFQQIYECTNFLQRLLKRRINFSSFLFKLEQRCNEEKKEWSKKTSALSTLFPNQTHNASEKWNDKKTFCRMQPKIVSYSINNLESKNNPKLKRNQGLLIKQAPRNKILRLYPCEKKSRNKTFKACKEDFQSLKINQIQA